MLIRRRMIQNLVLSGPMYRTRIYAYLVSAKMKFSYFYTRKIHFIYFINEILV